MGGVLAIDWGERKCGFAATDALRIVRAPLGVLRHEGREPDLLAHLDRLLAERELSVLVVGRPQGGRTGSRAGVIGAFAERLRTRYPDVRVEEWDEHLTTKEAEARLRALGRTGREVRAERDSWSALVLLEDWLSCHPA